MAEQTKATKRGPPQGSGQGRSRQPAKTGESTATSGSTAAARGGTPLVQWRMVPVPVPVGVHVPGVRLQTPQLRLPHIDVASPARAAAGQAGRVVGTLRSRVPTPGRLAYYGTLGGLAVLGAVEWPVAAAIGAGVWVASRSGRSTDQPDRQQEADTSGTGSTRARAR